jgi:hypothetical protein
VDGANCWEKARGTEKVSSEKRKGLVWLGE